MGQRDRKWAWGMKAGEEGQSHAHIRVHTHSPPPHPEAARSSSGSSDYLTILFNFFLFKRKLIVVRIHIT